ncbi:response regulator [Maribacter sp. PR1]|uniref:Response regulator n=1 Tax=Maribacter cobaltidurans TaxID=1178778 RepID=A0ABU7IUN4_9FLAO|nr:MULTISPECIES: response regulator [Maribacter]MDC6389285.1 response regulator [Maribacter sp. PR1]MEE1976673.1 response regulator [Maribacter cobaltidurans]
MEKSNILLVDDDEIYLYLMEKSIQKLTDDLVVNSFTDGAQAIDFISDQVQKGRELPEIILLDINMPFLDGWGFLAEFKKLKPKLEQHINIYMISSSSREEDIKRAKSFEELTGYMIKPLKEDELTEIFKKAYNDSW